MANVVVEMSGDEGRLWKSYQKIIDQSKKLDDGHRKVKQSGQEAGRQLEQSFGQQAHTRLVNFATGLGSLATAANVFRSAMAESKAATDSAMASVQGLVDMRRQLLQLGAGNQQNNLRADTLAARYGVSRADARQLMFSAQSEGFTGAAPEIAKLAGANILTVDAASKAAGQIPRLFPKSPITAMEAINATLTAAQQSRLNFEQVAGALPMASEGAAMAGASPAETMALTSVLASRFASGEAAAARIKAIGSLAATRPGMAGGGIVGAVEQMQGMPESERKKILGRSQELQAAYMAISEEMPVIRQRQTQIEAAIAATGTPASATARAIQSAFDVRSSEGRLNAQRVSLERAKIAQEVQREGQLAGGGFDRQQAVLQSQSLAEERGVNFITRWASGTAAQGLASAGAPPEAIMAVTRALQASAEMNPLAWRRGMVDDRRDDVSDIIQALRGVAENMLNNSSTARQRAAAAVQPE